jgi:cytochrome c biogenesis protein CcmG/thiol:disulfide interchange protein DsbE
VAPVQDRPRWRRPTWVLPLGIGALLLVALVALADTGRSGASRPPIRPAPNFAAPLYGGGQLSTVGLHGRPAVLDFWASWCPSCRAELGTVEKVAASGRAVVAGIDVRDQPADAERALRAAGANYPSARDPDGRVAAAFALVGIPTLVVLDRCSQVIATFLGPVPAARVEAALASGQHCR